MSSALEGLRVLEIAEGISGPFCGKLMAGLGANVIKIEPPAGDASRQAGPFRNDEPDKEASGLFLYLNTGKKSVKLDIDSETDRAGIIDIARNTDVVIENYRPGLLDSVGLGYSDLVRHNLGLIMVSVTPFGQTGPYRDYLATDMVVHALAGEMYLAGRPEREPLKKGGSLAEYLGGLNAYLSALATLHARDAGGRGQSVDVSLVEGATSVLGMAVKRWAYARTVDRRRGADGHPWPNGVWPVRDGYILAYSRPAVDWWALFVRFMADVPEFADPRFATPDGRAQHVEELDGLFQSWLSGRSKEEVYHLAQQQGLPFGYIATAPDLLASPQLQKRKFFVKVDHPVAGKLSYAGAPFVMSKTPFSFARAPLLGEQTEEVLAARKRPVPARETPVEPSVSSKLPLDGVRVLDFSHVWAGPFCARLLGDLGAEVIKVESIGRYDPERGPTKIAPGVRGRVYPDGEPGERPYNRAGRFNAYNRSKLGITLDLRADSGLELARDLVKIADVVVENFSVGVLERFGLGYEACRDLRPDIVYISLPGFGRDGPEAKYAAYGLTQEAMSGLSSITGYPGELPLDTGVFYGDPTGGLFGAAAVVTALRHRRVSGEGQLIDLSQREAFASVLPELILEYALNERVISSTGNRHPLFAPHGCYRCHGDDAWVVINVETEEQFGALCEAMGSPQLPDDARFACMAARKRNEDELDAIVGAWTVQRDPYDVMHFLQGAGVPSGAVLSNQQLLEDPHYQARGYFEEETHPDAGTHATIGMPWKMSETPVHVRLPAPGLGQHNSLVLGETLGLTRNQLQMLVDQDIIGDEPLSARP